MPLGGGNGLTGGALAAGLLLRRGLHLHMLPRGRHVTFLLSLFQFSPSFFPVSDNSGVKSRTYFWNHI